MATRQDRLNAIARAHRKWEQQRLASDEPLPFQARPEPTAYPQHHLTVDASPEDEAALQRLVEAELAALD